MMGEGSAGDAGSNQFLPSGSPTDEVFDDSNTLSEGQSEGFYNEQAVDVESLRDPNRAERARQAAADASGIPPGQVPPISTDQSGLIIDPATGEPFPEQ